MTCLLNILQRKGVVGVSWHSLFWIIYWLLSVFICCKVEFISAKVILRQQFEIGKNSNLQCKLPDNIIKTTESLNPQFLLLSQLLLSAGNLLFSETSIMLLCGTLFLFTHDCCYLRHYRLPWCLLSLLFLALVIQSSLGFSAWHLLMPIYRHLFDDRTLWSQDF